MYNLLLIFAFMGTSMALPTPEINTSDGQESRKVLGSRVVTSVSVIMDGINNTKTYFSDAVGKPVAKPATPTQLASPINLLNPDRYEFYTFDDSGDLVKRLMTLDEIQGIIASGDGEPANYYSQSLSGDAPEQRVDEVINNVQNVLKEEIEAHKPLGVKPEINGPDISSTWNLILPAIFGASQNNVPDNLTNALVPETVSIDKETATEREPLKTTVLTNHEIATEAQTTTFVNTEAQTVKTTIITNEELKTTTFGNKESATETQPHKITVLTIEDTATETQPLRTTAFTVKETATEPQPLKTTVLAVKETTTEVQPLETTVFKVKETATEATVLAVKETVTEAQPHKTTVFTIKETATEAQPLKTTVLAIKQTATEAQPLKTTVLAVRETATEAQPLKTTTLAVKETATEAQPVKTTALEAKESTTEVQPFKTTVSTIKETATEAQPHKTTVLAVKETATKAQPLKTTVLTVKETATEAQPLRTTMLAIEKTATEAQPLRNTVMTVKETVTEAQVFNVATSTVEDTVTEATVLTETDLLTTTVLTNKETTTERHVLETATQEQKAKTTIKEQPQFTMSIDEESATSYSVNKETATEKLLPKTTFMNVDLIAEVVSTTQSDVKNVHITETTLSPSTEQSSTLKVEKATTAYTYNTSPVSMTQPSTVKQKQTPMFDDVTLSTIEGEDNITPSPLAVTEQQQVFAGVDGTSTIKLIEQPVVTYSPSTAQPSTLMESEPALINKFEINESTEPIVGTTWEAIEPSTMALKQTSTTLKLTVPQEQTTPRSETTSNEKNNSNFEDSSNYDNFPYEELLNLLSSIGTSSTTSSEFPTTPIQEVTTKAVKQMEENAQTTQAYVTERVEGESTNAEVSSETTTEFKQPQPSFDIDENINDALGSVINQMLNQDISQTTIENLPTTTYNSETEINTESTSSSLVDVSDKNRYEEIELEIGDASTTIGYEAKTIQPITDNEFVTSTEKKIATTIADYIKQNVTLPIKNLKTDSSDSEYKFNITEKPIMAVYLPTTDKPQTSEPEVYVITDFTKAATDPSPVTTTETFKVEVTEASTKQNVANLSSEPLKVTTTAPDFKITSEPTTQTFVSIETVTSSPKLEKQPEVHIINRVTPSTPKPDTTWTLVSTVAPHRTTVAAESDKISNTAVDLVPKPLQGFGLEDSTSSLEADVFQFTELCNELAFSFWNSVTSGISFARSVVVSPFATTSILAMVFLGARGATSGEMNDILKLDDMVTFNPHGVFKNVIESIEVSKKSGVAASVFVKELYSDKSKGKLLQFYKERVKQFYDGYVEEVSFKEINDIIRRRTNLLVKRQTWGKIPEYLKDNSLFVRPPLAAVSANIFQTDCSDASTNGRDGELHFVVLPSIRQRKLVPIPAVVYRSGFLAGYEPGLDATAVAIGSKDHTISTIFVIPGQQGIAAPGDGLVRLETRLIESAFKQNSWSRLLRSLIPRPGLEVQIPRFSHKSVINATAALQRMGLKDVFNSNKADLKGLNGIAHELYLSDIIQTNTFATCGEGRIDETHHSEIYPATTNRSFRRIRKIQNYHQQPSASGDLSEEPRDYQRAFHDPLYDPTFLSLPLQFRPRQARLPDAPRLRFDRPFLYFVRHNPTGLILHMGRFNPRLLP